MSRKQAHPAEPTLSLYLLEEHPPSTETPLVVTPTAAAEAVQVDCDRITFVLYDQGVPDIYTVCPDGSRLSQLTDGPAWESYPAWSPDGEQIAFASNLNGEDSQIYLMDADGGNPQQLTVDLTNDRPVWLPPTREDRLPHNRWGRVMVVADSGPGK